jgi:folylpolyglutamate synthase/dihydropteroate synthase
MVTPLSLATACCWLGGPHHHLPYSTLFCVDLLLQGRMRRLLADLGEPQAAWPAAVHVAGTKGKGSVVAMLAAILREAGYRAGAYTR